MCTDDVFATKSSPTATPYEYEILSGTSMNLIELGWTHTKTSCTEPITYTIEY